MTRFPLTDEEEARIQAGIAADPDNPELTDAQLASARPLADVLPDLAKSIRQAISLAVIGPSPQTEHEKPDNSADVG